MPDDRIKDKLLAKQQKAIENRKKQKKTGHQKYNELKETFKQMDFHHSIYIKSMEEWLYHKALEER